MAENHIEDCIQHLHIREPVVFDVVVEKKINRIKINYDNGRSYDVRGIRETNANVVKKNTGNFLIYEQSEPEQIEEGLFQRAHYAVDMRDVRSIDIYFNNGEVVSRKFLKRRK